MSFMEVFQPGLRHLREERERQRLMVARPPAAGPGSLGIDLEAGTAVIPGPRADDNAVQPPADTTAGDIAASPTAALTANDSAGSDDSLGSHDRLTSDDRPTSDDQITSDDRPTSDDDPGSLDASARRG